MSVGIPTWSLEPGTVVATVPGNPANLTHGLSGKVTKVGRKWVHVEMLSGRTVRFPMIGTAGFDTRVVGIRRVRGPEH